ncbi:MAG: hypothetical protein CMI32_07650, partial [Opitutales bacterium]|nr:hypothetical protein [Opitutales bacterium]
MSARITLVLLGCACLPGCGPDERSEKQTTEPPVEQSPRKIAPTKLEQTPRPTNAQKPLSGNNPQFRGTAQAMERERLRLDRTVYRHEMEAQAYGSTFVSLWDRLRSTEPFKVLRQFPFVRLEYRLPTEWKPLPLGMAGIRQAMLNGKPISLDNPGYLAKLKELEDAGWKIIQTEWHHSEFRPDKNGRAPQSVISFEIHSTKANAQQRCIIKGQLEVTWTLHKTNSGLRIPGTIKVQDASITDYIGKPAFAELLKIDPKKVDARLFPRVSPLMVYDLNKDGLPEIV